MSDSLWANILTAIPVTIAALASLVIALRTQHKVEKTDGKVGQLAQSVNGLLAERDRVNQAIGAAAGEIVGERRAEDVETARRLTEQQRHGREVGPHE